MSHDIIDNSQVKLAENLTAEIKHSCPVAEGVEVWRTVVDFRDTSESAGGLIKEYYVWVTGEYLEDKAGLKASEKSAQKSALDTAKRRYKESGNQIPVENGISLSNRHGEVIVDPRDFKHPLKINNE